MFSYTHVIHICKLYTRTYVPYNILMNQKEKRQLAIAYQAIRGQISWLEAGRKLGATRVHTRICTLLRMEHKEKVKNEE